MYYIYLSSKIYLIKLIKNLEDYTDLMGMLNVHLEYC